MEWHISGVVGKVNAKVNARVNTRARERAVGGYTNEGKISLPNHLYLS